MLYRYENSLAKEGASGLNLGFIGGTPTFAADSPVEGHETSLQLKPGQGMAASSGPLSGYVDFSLGSWIKTSQSTYSYIISQRDADNDGEYILSMISSGEVCYWDYPSGTGSRMVCSTSSINDGQWHHIGMSRSGGMIRIYIDGNIELSKQFPVNRIESDNGLAIGYDQRDRRSYVSGQLKDLFIFSRALSDDEWLWLGKNGKSFPTE